MSALYNAALEDQIKTFSLIGELLGQRFPQLSGPSLPLCMGSAATVEAATAQREAYPCLQVAALFTL